jgi:hypothetical protein
LQAARVVSIDYAGARVEVVNSNGSAWARVTKAKSSGRLAGDVEMPNVGDTGVVSPLNGDSKSLVWLGSLNTIEKKNALETDGTFFKKVEDLVHAIFKKHETGSYWLLNKLGKLTSMLYRKAATESDKSKKHIGIVVNNDGSVTLTHYRGDNERKGTEFVLGKDGSFSLVLYNTDAGENKKGAEFLVSKDRDFAFNAYKDDGATIGFSFDGQVKGSTGGTCVLENDAHMVQFVAVPGSEIMEYRHKKKPLFMQFTELGDMNLNVNGSTLTIENESGDTTISHKSGSYVSVEQDAIEIETQDGSTVLVGKEQAQMALSTGQSIVFDNSGDIIELTAGNINIDCDVVQLGSGPLQQPLMTTGMLVQLNAERALLASHTHPAPGAPAVELAPLALPLMPIPFVNCTGQVTAV